MAITSGRTKVCQAVSGGVKTIWLADAVNVTSFTLGTTEYNAVVMELTEVFYKFEFDQDTGEFRENSEQSDNGGIITTQELEFFFKGLSQADRDILEDIIESSTCGIIAIVEDQDGTKWVLGYSEKQLKERPLEVASIASLTGKLFSDAKGSTTILSATTNELARTFDGVVPE